MRLAAGNQKLLKRKTIDEIAIERKLTKRNKEIMSHCVDYATILPELSAAETRIASMVDNLLTCNEIAEKLFLSHKTIKFHKTNIYKKLGIKSQFHLLRLIQLRMRELENI